MDALTGTLWVSRSTDVQREAENGVVMARSGRERSISSMRKGRRDLGFPTPAPEVTLMLYWTDILFLRAPLLDR